MKVKLVREWAGYGSGSVVDITWDVGVARLLIEKGYAEAAEPGAEERHRPDAGHRRLRKLNGGHEER
jgi:hypothetical protein